MSKTLPMEWNERLFEECITKVKYTDKQPTKSFLKEGLFPVISQEKDFINGYSNNKNAVFAVKKPVVIFGDHTKNIKYVDFDFVIGADGVKILQPIQEINSKYFYYYLCNIQLRDLGYARHYKLLRGCVVRYPPLSEQKRIVEKLDKIFANIDKAKENTKKNLQNAKEIFCSKLQNIFGNKNLHWIKYKLSEITTKIGSGATPLGGRKSYITTGISLIRSMNVHDNQFIYEELAHITKEQAEKLDNVTIQPGDLLLNITGASVARCCVVPEDVLPARVNQHVSILRPISEIINADFLCYLLTSKPYKKKLLNAGEEGGSTRQALTKEELKCFEVSIPKDIQKQEDIVAQLDALRSKTQELEQIYTKKLADLDELKQSILQQAFSGKL